MCNKYNFQCRTIDNLPPAQAVDAMRNLGSQGVNLIIASSNGYSDQLIQAAREFPNTWFVMTSDLPSTQGLPNVVAFVWNWYQFGWLGGVAAGYLTKTGKTGYVLGAPLLAAQQAMEGFRQGAQIGHPGTQVTFRLINSFNDAVAAREASQAMISAGVDVLTGIAGGANPGIIQASQSSRVSYIGYLADEYSTAPGSIPTSMVGNVAKEYDDLGRLYSSHQLQAKLYVGTVQDGTISLAQLRDIPADTASKIQQQVANLKDGKITIDETKLFPLQ